MVRGDRGTIWELSHIYLGLVPPQIGLDNKPSPEWSLKGCDRGVGFEREHRGIAPENSSFRLGLSSIVASPLWQTWWRPGPALSQWNWKRTGISALELGCAGDTGAIEEPYFIYLYSPPLKFYISYKRLKSVSINRNILYLEIEQDGYRLILIS